MELSLATAGRLQWRCPHCWEQRPICHSVPFSDTGPYLTLYGISLCGSLWLGWQVHMEVISLAVQWVKHLTGKDWCGCCTACTGLYSQQCVSRTRGIYPMLWGVFTACARQRWDRVRSPPPSLHQMKAGKVNPYCLSVPSSIPVTDEAKVQFSRRKDATGWWWMLPFPKDPSKCYEGAKSEGWQKEGRAQTC